MKNCHVSADQFSCHRLLLAIGLVVIAGAMSLLLGRRGQFSQPPDSNQLTSSPLFGNAFFSSSALVLDSQQQKLRAVSPQFPLSFEPNQGQTDPQVKFLARGRGYGLFLTANEAVLKLQHPRTADTRAALSKASVVRMKLEGAKSDPLVMGADELPGRSNYILGSDSSKWLLNVPQYARVRYHEIYPGVDLVFYGKQGQLEYDFEVAPGADPKVIQLRIEGASKLVLDSDGNLVVPTNGGDLRLHAPTVYVATAEGRKPVLGKFLLTSNHHVGFSLGAYDRRGTLVIDPVLTYSTYLGGSGNEGCSAITGVPTSGCPAIAVDSAFNFYVVGPTSSSNFPLTLNPPGPAPFQSALNTTTAVNLFVTKFNASGGLQFSTYLGGNGVDTSAGIAVDSLGNVYVAGTTTSSNFPTMNGFQGPPMPADGRSHAFVTVLTPDLNSLMYSTYLSGDTASTSSTDVATGLAIDNRGNAYVIGNTTSTNTSPGFPATVGAFQTAPKGGAAQQFFFSKINTTVSGVGSLVYSTYLGGSTPANGVATGGGIAVDPTGKVYVTGGTDFTDMPVLNASQPTSAGGKDVFVGKFDPTLPGLQGRLYLTYLGGSGDDIGNAIAVDTAGNAYVTGSTISSNIPPSSNAFQPSNSGAASGASDAFVAKFNNPSSGSVSLTYFSYLGGSGTDVGTAIAVDANQITRVTGWTTSADFPATENPPAFAGVRDAFFARIDTTATANFARYLGGSQADAGTGIALDPNFNAFVSGDTSSPDFPHSSSSDFPPGSSPAFQPTLNGPSDVFIAKAVASSDLAITKLSPSVTTTCPGSSTLCASVGNQVTFAFTVGNQGPDATTGVTFTDTLPSSGATFNSISATLGNCGVPVGGTVSCLLGAMGSGSTATVNVVLTPTTPVAVPPGFFNIATVSAQPSVNAPSIDPNLTNNTVPSTPMVVSDFGVSVNPSTTVVPAGTSATYQVMLTPIPIYSANVSLSCSAGLPSGTSCTFSTNPLSLPNTSTMTSTLTISTTARPVTTTGLRRRRGFFYALVLPISGFAFVGLGISNLCRRRWLAVPFIAVVLSLMIFQLACGSSSKAPTPTGGTPAGTYAITVTGTSGSASHSTTTTLVVQ